MLSLFKTNFSRVAMEEGAGHPLPYFEFLTLCQIRFKIDYNS